MAPRRPQPADRARLTSRAAVLAVVICAVALSLAYPIREYIAQRRQIDQLHAQQQVLLTKIAYWESKRQHLRNPAYIERLAMDKLHMCPPGATCYVLQTPAVAGGRARAAAAETPWYERLWHSVKEADRGGISR